MPSVRVMSVAIRRRITFDVTFLIFSGAITSRPARLFVNRSCFRSRRVAPAAFAHARIAFPDFGTSKYVPRRFGRTSSPSTRNGMVPL